MIFEQMLNAPTNTDKWFIHTSAGGLNECIKIGAKSCLPNCVGFAWGLFSKRLNKKANLSKGNAEIWYGKMDGYERGQSPRLGAIACWSKGLVGVGSDGAGHVAVVEGIEEDGTIITSNSAYKGSRFFTKTIKPPYKMNGYNFQGFIYLPIEFDNANEFDKFNYKDFKDPVVLPNEINLEEIVQDVINGIYGNGEERKRNLEEKGLNYVEIQDMVNERLGVKKVETSQTEIIYNTNYKVGDYVNFDYLYIDSFGSKKLKSNKHSGRITKIYKGRPAPYLIDNVVGFLSEDLIIK